MFEQVKQGLLNWFGDTNTPEKKEGLTELDLKRFHAHLNPLLFADVRDFCAYTFAFYGLLRIREYSNGSLKMSEVKINPSKSGIQLIITHSKTQLVPVKIDISRRQDILCPIQACTDYYKLIPPDSRKPHYPFFLHSPSSSEPMSDSEFIYRLKSLVCRTLPGANPQSYSGHSFRRGGATAMHLANVPEATIQAHGRWTSLVFRQYFDTQHNESLRLAATSQLRDFGQQQRQRQQDNSTDISSTNSSSSSSSSNSHLPRSLI